MSIFTDIFIRGPRRSKQVLDHPVFTTTDFGKIIPILVEDVLPGDVFKVRTAAEIKLFPTLAPMKQGIECRIDYFFVPNRLLWKDWQVFITGGEDGTAAPVKPFLDGSQNTEIGSLFDYMGLAPTIDEGARGNPYLLEPAFGEGSTPIDAMPFRAYEMIYREYYRDENLQEESPILLTGGADDTYYDLRYRGFKKDYFTSALPWTQRGPQVTIPLSGSAPINAQLTKDGGIPPVLETDINGGYFKLNQEFASTDYSTRVFRDPGDYNNASLEIELDGLHDPIYHEHTLNNPLSGVGVSGTADLSNASAVSINELRRLNSVQKWLERNARAGGRYIEQILSHFGVRTPDYRLDRPEYIGGCKQVIGMAEILQTSETANSPQGSRAGVGFGNMLASSKKYRIDEHGWVLGLMSIIPSQNIYCDGFQRKWTRQTKFDYFFPEFQNLGEQAIKSYEIYAYDQGHRDDDFGYTPRYAEYRYHPGVVTGQMRTSMAYWHMARLFNFRPTLSGDFINTYASIDDFDRLFPTDVKLGDRFVVYMQHFERLKRPMQKNPNPSL